MTAQGIHECQSQAVLDAHAAAMVLHGRLTHDESGAFIEIFEEAFSETVLTEAARSRGALSGVPFGVKDNIRVAGHATRAGSPALTDQVSTADAEVVAALRRAGAIPFGSLNMHELALGTTSDNAHFGAVHNPVDPTRSPGGSSGGSAAAIAAGFIPFALGTDTGGSCRIPAAHCGIVGMRPTMGRYSSDGLVALSPIRDTIGVMANSVADVALVDAIITGEADAQAPELDFPELVLPELGLPELYLPELRLGLPRRGFFDDLDPEVATVVEFALERLADAGAVLVETEVVDSHVMAPVGFNAVAYEAPRQIVSLLFPDRAGDLRDEWNDALSDAEVAAVNAFIARVASPDVAAILTHFLEHPISAATYAEALRVRTQLQSAYADAFERDALDALLYPTVPVVAQPIGATTVRLNGVERELFPVSIRNTDPGSFAGQPSLSVPIARRAGTLPIGLGIEGKQGDDRHLLAVSKCIENILTTI